MKSDFIRSVFVYFLLSIIFIISMVGLYRKGEKHYLASNEIIKYSQPNLAYGKYPWAVRSVDTQVISKHWPDVTQEAVAEQVALIKNLGVNYIAVGTPYDRADDLTLWVNEIHKAGLKVWFRSHWDGWEGDEGYPSTMSPDDYLYKTEQFILSNPNLFVAGDAFTVTVEAEQVGVGLGKRFLTWDEYRSFLLSEISVANKAFTQIGLGNQVYTNWLSLNGWVAANQLNKDIVDKVGLIVVDHFVGQSQTIGEYENIDAMVQQTVYDLDNFYNKWRVPILLGEWGYPIYQEVSEDRQAEAVQKLMEKLKDKPYLVGVNYWVHMGNSAALISDQYGTNLKYREAAKVVKSYYDPFSPPLVIK